MRRFHNEELHILYLLSNIARVIKFKRMEDGRSAFEILTVKFTGNIPLRKPTRRWDNYIRMGLREIGINARNWIDPALYSNYLRELVNYGIEPLSSISHGVSI